MAIQITEREMDARFETVHAKLDNILVQVTRVNGRLDKVEEKVNEHDKTFTRVKTVWGLGAVGIGMFGKQLMEGVKRWLTS